MSQPGAEDLAKLVVQNALARSAVLLHACYVELQKAGRATLLVIECEEFFIEVTTSIQEALEAENTAVSTSAPSAAIPGAEWKGWTSPGVSSRSVPPVKSAPATPAKSPEVSSSPLSGGITPTEEPSKLSLAERVKRSYGMKP